jgi:hypothetical protein
MWFREYSANSQEEITTILELIGTQGDTGFLASIVYNTAGNIDTLVQDYYPHIPTSRYIQRRRCFYNVQEQMIRYFTEVYDDNSWKMRAKDTLIYNAQGQLSTQIGYRMNATSNQFELGSKNESQYDAQGNLIREVYSIYDKNTGTWDIYSTINLKRDLQGRIVVKADSNKFGSNFRPRLREETSYDAQGRVATILRDQK